MVAPDLDGGASGQPTTVSQPRRRFPPFGPEQDRRVAHGKMIGAKVAEAYRKLTEAK